MAFLGLIVLWGLAIFGFVALCGLIGVAVDDRGKKPEAKPPVPPRQPQITNLRAMPTPVEQPQVLSKTTMQITTTRYLDPNEGKKAITNGE